MKSKLCIHTHRTSVLSAAHSELMLIYKYIEEEETSQKKSKFNRQFIQVYNTSIYVKYELEMEKRRQKK
jgi:hypothetical protein